MRMKLMIAAVVVLVAALGVVAWRNSVEPVVPEAQAPAPPGETGSMAEEPADPGIEWDVPAGWSPGGGRSMRLATYTVPGAGDAHAAECAVFYFAPRSAASKPP